MNPSVWHHALVGGDPGDPFGKGARPLCGSRESHGVGSRFRAGVGCPACLVYLNAAEAARNDGADGTVSIHAATAATSLTLQLFAEALYTGADGEAAIGNDPGYLAHEAARNVADGGDVNVDRIGDAAINLFVAVRRFHAAMRHGDTLGSIARQVPEFPNGPEVSG